MYSLPLWSSYSSHCNRKCEMVSWVWQCSQYGVSEILNLWKLLFKTVCHILNLKRAVFIFLEGESIGVGEETVFLKWERKIPLWWTRWSLVQEVFQNFRCVLCNKRIMSSSCKGCSIILLLCAYLGNNISRHLHTHTKKKIKQRILIKILI